MLTPKMKVAVLMQVSAGIILLTPAARADEPEEECGAKNHLEYWCSGCQQMGPEEWFSSVWQCQTKGTGYEWYPRPSLSYESGSDQKACVANAAACEKLKGENENR